MGNATYTKSICSVFQSRFKRFKKIEKIDTLKNKDFYLDLVRVCYIYVKENLVEYNLDMFFKYFTETELEEYRVELAEIKENRDLFLKD